MGSESSNEFSKLRWIFMYSIWALAELTSIAGFVCSFYSIITLICGNWAGAAFFAGIIPGIVLSVVRLCVYMLVRIPWRPGDYHSDPYYEYRVRQVRLFHTILWTNDESKALPHFGIRLDSLDSEGMKNGFLVYARQGREGYRGSRQSRWMAYLWAVLCELFVFAVIFFSIWFMVWAGIETSVYFLSGLLLFPNGMGVLHYALLRTEALDPDKVPVVGLTWVIAKDHDTLYLKHSMTSNYEMELASEACQEQRESKEEFSEA